MPRPPRCPIVTIDGPSGSGKGTISRAVAQHVGWHLLDSGALYRLVALAGVSAGAASEDAQPHAELAARMEVTFGSGPDGSERVWLEGRDVTAAIRSETAGQGASRVAAWPAARTAGQAATREAPWPAVSERIAAVTSRPSSHTRSLPSGPEPNVTSMRAASSAWRCTSSLAAPADTPASATSRYSAPLSSRCQPTCCATARLMVPLPEPLGPSMVTMGHLGGRGILIRLRQSASTAKPAARAVPANPGNEVATLATSRISMGARALNAATANAMATR